MSRYIFGYCLTSKISINIADLGDGYPEILYINPSKYYNEQYFSIYNDALGIDPRNKGTNAKLLASRAELYAKVYLTIYLSVYSFIYLIIYIYLYIYISIHPKIRIPLYNYRRKLCAKVHVFIDFYLHI